MRILFVAGGSAATVFALVPLATAARNAGHEVFMAATSEIAPVIASTGLPPVAASAEPLSRFIYSDRVGAPAAIPTQPDEQMAYTGVFHARMGAAWLPVLADLARDWRPDIVVGGTLAYAASLLAARLGVPWVRHTWDAIDSQAADAGAERELAAELAELGLAAMPPADLLVEVCPPSLLPPQSLPALRSVPLRWVAVGGQRSLEPWMYRRGSRPRICLTAGSRVARQELRDGQRDYRQVSLDFLHELADPLAKLDAELLIAVPDQAAGELRGLLGERAHVGWMPLDVVARHSDLILHNGGGVTSMTALSAGLPQVAVPQGAMLVPAAARVATYGASVMLLPGGDTAERAVAACEAVLATPGYAAHAAALAEEIAALPAAAEVLHVVTDLVAKGAPGRRPSTSR